MLGDTLSYIRIGGHGTSGDSSIEGGLLINLRRMNTISVDTTALTISCAGGCTWAEVDAAMEPHNMSCVGGTVNQTGIAGYTLGGGFGWLTGAHGLAIDNLISAEIVLADGRIVRASATESPDLYWAIRGAGHMFGIVTEFVFQGFHQPNPVYGGMVIIPPTPAAIEHLIHFANHIAATSDGRTAMMCGFATPPHIGKRIIFGTCFHNGSETEGAAIFAPLVTGTSNVKPIRSTLSAMPYPKMNFVLAMAANSDGRRVSKGVSYAGPLPPSAFQRVLDMYEAFVLRVPEAGEVGSCLFEFYALDKLASVGVAETAYVGRARHANAMIIPCWKTPERDEDCRRFARDAMDAVSEEVRASRRTGGEGEVEEEEDAPDYLNYDGLGGTPAEKTFGVNYPRLQALKNRYDPHNAFTKRSGGLVAQPAPKDPAQQKDNALHVSKHAKLDSESCPALSASSPSSSSDSASASEPTSSASTPAELSTSPASEAETGEAPTTPIEALTHQVAGHPLGAKMEGVNVSVTALSAEEERGN